MTFALDLAKFAQKAGKSADLVVRKVGIEVLSGVVKRSAVKTGRFRFNWNTAIGSADATTSTGTDPSGDGAIASGEAKLADFQVGPSIFITNSLPYGPRLENGYSDQAPNGMVRITVAEWRDYVRKAVAEL